MQNAIFKKNYWRQYLLYGFIAAILYSAFTYIFIRNASFEDTWWIYAGNGGFMLVIFLYCLKLTMSKGVRLGAMNTLMAGNLTTVAGILAACVINLVLVYIFVPRLFSTTQTLTLANEPPAMLQGKTHGLLFTVFSNAIFCNFMTGSFISLLTAYSIKTNQKKDRPAVLN